MVAEKGVTLEQLAKEVENLKKQVEENAWSKDYLEIWKLQSLYSHLYHVGRGSEVPSLFAQKTPGVVMEIEDSGVYEGLESVTYFWTQVFDVNRMQRSPGFLAIHMTCNPVLEINKKRTRAKGVWHSHGVCSLAALGVMKQFTCLGKYDIEYVKEDGKWKFLNFAYRLTYMAPYEKGWMDEPQAASIAGNPLNKPDKPTTYHMPYSKYRINIMQPPPPEPYQD
jgi:hypothetical protein